MILLCKGCNGIKDRFTVYMKTSMEAIYVVLKENDLLKSNSANSWTENIINLNLTSKSSLYVNFILTEFRTFAFHYLRKLKVA